MEEKLCYKSNVARIQKYIDSRLDLLEQKNLVFVFNVSEGHWVSVVVIIPFFLVFEQCLNKEKDESFTDGALGKDATAGWCVLNSIYGDRNIEKMDSREPLT
jgi:hypothetical protein